MEQEPMARCKVLTKKVQSCVRTGMAVTSMAHCIQELVMNSIDAKATKVYVGFDLETYSVQVEDDGVGVSKEDLPVLGTRWVFFKVF